MCNNLMHHQCHVMSCNETIVCGGGILVLFMHRLSFSANPGCV